MSKTIRHEFFFAQPAKTVWDYLTKPELMEQWLMKNNFLPIIGYDFQFKTNPVPSLDIDGIFHCKVLEIVPHKKLSYSWKCGPGNGKITLDSIVVWTLESKNNGTQLTLEHSGFKELENYSIYTGLTDGWATNMEKLNNRMNNSANGTTNV
jgi:uncharacterized protein YndB with AHSA1/START domain